MQDNPYEILQVSEKAEPEVIDGAYRRLALKYHPDTNHSPSAKEKMQKINWAYDLLKDPKKRAAVDFDLSQRKRRSQTNPDFTDREREREREKEQEHEKERQREKEREREREKEQEREKERQREKEREREREQELERIKQREKELEEELERERKRQKEQEHEREKWSSPSPQDSRNTTFQPQSRGINKPTVIKTILVSILLLVIYYVFTIVVTIIGASNYWLDKRFNITVVIIASIFSIIVARIATIGWNPTRKSIFRTLLLFLLMIFPAFTWITCYLASKAITKADLISNKGRKLKIFFIAYGLTSTVLGILVFGNVLPNVNYTETPVNYLVFNNSDIGIAFSYPDFIVIDSHIDKQRTDAGSIFTVSTITGQSLDPVLLLGLQITEDPLRNSLFPELYPPDDTALKLLVLREMTDIPIITKEIPDAVFEKSYQDLVITKYSQKPAVEYKFALNDTAIGDAIVYGVLIVTDQRDISIKFIASIESNTEGSVSEAYAGKIWTEMMGTMDIFY